MNLPGSCCRGPHTNRDVHAQRVVATLMDIKAETSKPCAIIGHGDNFYWSGITSLQSREARFKATFEDVYKGPNIINTTWYGTMGNHDYCGGSFCCEQNDTLVPCPNTSALLEALETKLQLQATYHSPNNDRWNLKDHFYVERIEDCATGVSIDIFNIDTNYADVAGARSVCCQCYGYSNGDDAACDNVARGDRYCCGGDTNMYDSCMAKFTEWSEASLRQLAEEAATSNATWKVVNTHFSFIDHMNEVRMKKWISTLEGLSITVYINGHTHGCKQEFLRSIGVHLVENGAGGGAKSEAAFLPPSYAASQIDTYYRYQENEYGFISMEATKESLKLEYNTADSRWNYTDNFEDVVVGGVQVKHCWIIMKNNTAGMACPTTGGGQM